jgi:hypothetical protein
MHEIEQSGQDGHQHGPPEIKRPPVAPRADAELCQGPHCTNAASFTCTFCGRADCAEHGSGVTIFKLFRLRTDWPEELVDLLNSISNPRSRIWLCERCQQGAPAYSWRRRTTWPRVVSDEVAHTAWRIARCAGVPPVLGCSSGSSDGKPFLKAPVILFQAISSRGDCKAAR